MSLNLGLAAVFLVLWIALSRLERNLWRKWFGYNGPWDPRAWVKRTR